MSAGKLTQNQPKIFTKSHKRGVPSFIAELTGSGAVSASDLVHTVSAVFGAPLLDLDAIDPLRLPKDLLDAKICSAYQVVVLSGETTGSSWPRQTQRIKRLPRRSNSLPKWEWTGLLRNTTN